MSRFQLETDCISADGDDIEAMCDAGRKITLATFKRRTEWLDWAESMGYSRTRRTGLPLHRDYHVTYYRSRYRGRACYYAKHSAIEYVFTAAA
jgi:hypothetical protein